MGWRACGMLAAPAFPSPAGRPPRTGATRPLRVPALSSPSAPHDPAVAAIPLRPAEFRAAIAAVLTTILLGALDQSIVSVALPTIASRLGGVDGMAWVISAYLIASTVVTPLYGRLSDQFGRRLTLTVAIGVFIVASVACAMAQTMPQLVLARVLQGAGGGGLIATGQSLIADVVPMRERGRYQSYISIVWAVSSVAGPVVGGVITQYLSWTWIFWMNLPLGALALALVRGGLARLPAPAAGPSRRVDWLGAALLLAGLTALLLPITRVGQGAPLLAPAQLGGLALAVALLVAFGWHARRTPEPILPLGLLAQPVVLACSGMLFVCFFVFIALTLLVPLRLQLVGGLAPGEAALHLLPLTLGIPIAAFTSGRYTYLTGRVRPLQRAGVWLVPLGLLATAATPPTGGWTMSAALLLLGVGFGFQMPTTLITVQQSVPRAQLGTATALTAFFRLLGGAVGVAVLSSVLLALLRERLDPAVLAQGLEALLAHAATGSSAAAGSGALAVSDLPFRDTLWLSAAVSLLAVMCARALPDVRLRDASAPVSAAAVE